MLTRADLKGLNLKSMMKSIDAFDGDLGSPSSPTPRKKDRVSIDTLPPGPYAIKGWPIQKHDGSYRCL